MAAAIFKTYKKSDAADYEKEWCNRYVIDVSQVGYNNTCLTHANRLLQWERRFHGTHVKFLRTEITEDTITAPQQGEPAAATYGYGSQNLRGERQTLEALPFEYCLTWKKSVISGRPGRVWYRGCLNKTDVVEIEGARTGLANGDYWLTFRNDWLGITLGATLYSMRVPQVAHEDRSNIGYSPVTDLVLSGVSITKASKRLHAKLPSPGQAVYGAIAGTCEKIGEVYSVMLAYHGLFLDFVPVEAKTWTEDCISGSFAAAQQAKKFIEGDQNEGGQAPGMAVRWGLTEGSIMSLAATVKEKKEKDIEQLGQMQPYFHASGDYYFTHGQLEEMQEIVERYGKLMARMADTDWLNPHIKG